jgi:circadian clock protein KaiC
VGDQATIRRAIAVLKMRGSDHDKSFREFRIDNNGMQILEPLALREWAGLPQVG